MSAESADDRASFFELEDFGVAALWTHAGTSATVNGIFAQAGSSVAGGMGSAEILETSSSFLCASEGMLAGAGQGDTLVIAGIEYVVRALHPRNGLFLAELEKQAA